MQAAFTPAAPGGIGHRAVPICRLTLARASRLGLSFCMASLRTVQTPCALPNQGTWPTHQALGLLLTLLTLPLGARIALARWPGRLIDRNARPLRDDLVGHVGRNVAWPVQALPAYRVDPPGQAAVAERLL